jgi:hypothetical protein
MSKKGTFGSNSRNDPLERSRGQNPDSGLVSGPSPCSEPESGEQLESKDAGAMHSKQKQRQLFRKLNNCLNLQIQPRNLIMWNVIRHLLCLDFNEYEYNWLLVTVIIWLMLSVFIRLKVITFSNFLCNANGLSLLKLTFKLHYQKTPNWSSCLTLLN